MRTFLFYAHFGLVVLAWFVVSMAFTLLALPMWGSPRLASWYGHSMSVVAMRLFGVRVDVRHRERLRASQPCVYVVNHQSNLDFLFLGTAFPPKTVIIAKREVAWIPLFGLLFMATRNILIDRRVHTRAIAGLDLAVSALQTRGDSILIFPEGTRNRTGERLGRFKKGAFHMAIAAQVPVVPIVVSPMADNLDFQAKRVRGGTCSIDVLEALPTTGLAAGDVEQLLARTHAAMWQGLEAMAGPAAASDVPGDEPGAPLPTPTDLPA